MKPFLFERSVEISATCEALFAFHENPRNISKIAPPSLKLHSVKCEPRAEPGGIFQIQASQFGLPIYWTGQWESVEAPHRVVDVALESPFALWRHSHIFEEIPGGCRMTDRVEYLLKGGLAGALASALVLPLVFSAMFRARHAATRRHFKNQ